MGSLRGVSLPEPYARDPEWQRAIPFEMVRAAASLAEVDHWAVGLAGFGRPDNWLERQVGRWRSQLEGYLELPGVPGHLYSTRGVGGRLVGSQSSRGRSDRDLAR